VRDQTLHFGAAIHCFGAEIAAEAGFGVKVDTGEMQLAAIADHDGPVVGQILGKQRHAEQHEKE
jgi:hypothetical protein